MKASKHRQAILIFGVALPFALVLGLIATTLYGRAKLNRAHTEKVANLESYQRATSQTNELEAMLSLDDRREKVAYWNSKLDQDFIQTLTQNLNTILAKYDESVLKQTEMSQVSGGAASIGGKTENPHSRIQLSFEGGFKPMQLLLAELETEMPQLILEDLAIRSTPAASEGSTGQLHFAVTYLCWEKPKS